MEIAMLVILSIFAFLGAMFTVLCLFRLSKTRFTDKGIKLILYLPHNSCSKLEGIIRQIYYEGIPEKFMTDGKIYLMISRQDAETMKILEKLRDMYPIEVLPEEVSYCMITNR